VASDRKKPEGLKNRWDHLEGLKSSIAGLCVEYAKWTLPYLFPSGAPGDSKNIEMQTAMDSIGAQAVNHLSNKVVSTLFPPQSMFFRLHVDAKAKQVLAAAMQAQGGGDGEVAQALGALDTQLLAVEQQAQDYLGMVAYRPQAVRAAQLLIITGNAMEFHPEGKPVQVYSLKDYCVVRDLSGEVIEIMTKESKAFETFHPEVQKQIREPKKRKSEYDEHTEVVIYTRIVLEDDGKFHVYQSADHVTLDTEGATFPRDKLPWIVLTWNLVRGEDYGRGLVGDYSGAFHAINTLSGALLNIAAIMGDIKFLVKPSSVIDVQEINQSPPGSYHSGNPDDVTTIKLDRMNEAQFIQGMIDRYEKQISNAFLLMSTRQAERVTAEEIRQDANELEMSNGGIYSRLAFTWQQPLAFIILDQIDFNGLEHGITPKIITGMDSLSRTSELDNIRMWVADMAMLNGIPEDARAVIDIQKFAEVVGTNRQVEYKKFVLTPQQIQAKQEQAMQAQAQMQQNEAAGNVATEAGKAAVQQAA
jgi:hypothetical protein